MDKYDSLLELITNKEREYPTRQPDHGKYHVFSPTQLRAGHVYRKINSKPVRHSHLFILMTPPRDGRVNIRRVDCGYEYEGFTDYMYLSDVGLEPYSGGAWNTHNHIEFVRKEWPNG